MHLQFGSFNFAVLLKKFRTLPIFWECFKIGIIVTVLNICFYCPFFFLHPSVHNVESTGIYR